MKFEQNFPNLLDMAVGVERVHAAPVWNAQAAGRAATTRWWQQRVQMAMTTKVINSI
jgi:hypothetical protein